MDLKESIELLNKLFEKYIDDPLIEIEARLGIYDEDNSKFDSNIGDVFFSNIQKLLNSGRGDGWGKTTNINQTDYSHKNLRLSVDENGTQRCLEKVRIADINFIIDNGPLDFRISFSKEVPNDVANFPVDKEHKFVRHKTRTSYSYKMWSFDVTEVKNVKKDSEEITYQYEIELNKEVNKEKNCTYLGHSILLKIIDAVKVCGDIDDTCKLRIVKSKNLKELDKIDKITEDLESKCNLKK